jgi:hypothetical protein
MSDSYPIIPSTSYFSTTADNLATPEWFNTVFTNINSKSQANNKYTRPVQIATSSPSIGWKGSSLTSVTEVMPGTIKLKELGHEFLPNSNYTVSHQWTIQNSTGFSFVDLDQDGIADSNVAEVQISHSGALISSSLEVICEVTYIFNDGTNPAETTVTSAIFGLPCIHIVDGQAAIATTVPLIHIPVTHQPLLTPGGFAEFSPENISLIPPGQAVTVTAWSLTHGNTDKSQYIENASTNTPTVKIPEVGKEYTLTLMLSDSSTTSTKLHTYDYGSFFFSSWDSTTPVDSPRKVFVSSAPVSDSAIGQIFPNNNSKVSVKWGRDIEEVQLQNGSVGTGYVYCVPGFSQVAANSLDVQTIMQEYGVGDENIENYSLVNMNSNNENLIGLKFWTSNMSSSAKIVHKVESPNTSLNVAQVLDYQLSGNSVYLVKGVCPQGQQSTVSVGPGAERYYVWLKHFKNGTYLGAYDRYAVLTQSGSASPVMAVFNMLPLGADFRAEVVSANGSSYSISKTSEDMITTASKTAAEIISVESSSSQYGVTLDIEHDSSGEAPVGYLVTYKEYDLTTSIPSSISLPFSPGYSNHSTIYSTSSSVKIPATVNKKVMASVRSVMSDGVISDSVIAGPTTVTMPSDVSLTGFSMGMGRHNSKLVWKLSDFSLLDDTTPQETLAYYSFGRDTFIESFIINVHRHPAATAINVVLEYDGITDANDQKVIEIPTGGNTNQTYSITDLSIPITAGTFISVGVQHLDGSGTEITDGVDFTANVYYSHGNIVTVSNSGSNQPIN